MVIRSSFSTLLIMHVLLQMWLIMVCAQPADEAKAQANINRSFLIGPRRQTNLRAQVGKNVFICGRAMNAKAGAVLKTEEGDVIYLESLPAWPPEKVSSRICGRGKLGFKKFIPEPQYGAAGEISQGAIGKQFVLERFRLKKQGKHNHIF